jgi:dimethylamine monooxygenase subunit A
MILPRQPNYFPPANGRYEIGPGLSRLGTDFGQGDADQKAFQFDFHFDHYRLVKLAGHYENPDKYYVQHHLEPETMAGIVEFMIERLCQESPDLFTRHTLNGITRLECRLTGEILVFDTDYMLVETRGAGFDYKDGLDALALQVQEDLAVIQLDADGRNTLCALHLCFPNFWSAADKIGKDFVAIHGPVPGMGDINRHAPQLVNTMIHKCPCVRFAWGITTDDQLNHHPDTAGTGSPSTMERIFDPHHPELYLRVERQVMAGLPKQNAAVFTIRTYLYDITDVIRIPDQQRALISALRSMSAETLHYKGLARSLPDILDWISGLPTSNQVV